MNHTWFSVLMILLIAGCAGQANISVVVVGSEDLTATAMFVPPIEVDHSQHSPMPTRIADSGRCTAFNSLGTEIYLRNYPDAQHDMVATWLPDAPLEALGRSDNGWIFLRIPPEGRGWVSGEVMLLGGSCNNLPVLTSANLRSPDYKLPCRVSSATGSVVSLHNLPAFDSQIVGELPQGYLMESRQRTQGGWYYLDDFLETLPQNWNQGWAYESSLHLNGTCGGITPEEAPASAAVILASGETIPTGCVGTNDDMDRINIYADPSTDSTLLSWVLPDESIRVSLRNTQGWVMTEYDAFRGWIQPDELELSGDCDQLPSLP